MYRSFLIKGSWRNLPQLAKLDYARPMVCHLVSSPITIRRNSSVTTVEDSYVKKFMKAVGWMDQSRTRLKLTGYFLYEIVPESVDYAAWFEQCDLPDTFASWFSVTELHVWLLMVRCMAEDVSMRTKKYVKGDGYFLRNCIVEALWADVGNRIKLLEGANPAIARKQVAELSEQFQAALVSYDEGLEDDRALAAAVWRRFYALSPDANAEHVERIVQFIRHQLSVLDKEEKLISDRPTLQWISICGNKTKHNVSKPIL